FLSKTYDLRGCEPSNGPGGNSTDSRRYIRKGKPIDLTIKTIEMKTYTRIEVLNAMESTGLVPLYYHPEPEIMCEVVQACYQGGARLFEFTSRGPLAHEVFTILVKFCQKNCPDLILGVGSVTDAASASLYMQLGAQFIVTPVFREDIARVCNR